MNKYAIKILKSVCFMLSTLICTVIAIHKYTILVYNYEMIVNYFNSKTFYKILP
jgi:hypothetical protein